MSSTIITLEDSITVLVGRDGEIYGAELPNGERIPYLTSCAISAEVGQAQKATLVVEGIRLRYRPLDEERSA